MVSGGTQVLQGMYKTTHERVAAKMLDLGHRRVKLEDVQAEVATMASLEHLNVIGLREVIYQVRFGPLASE